ncbi:MAG: sensor histidine kinase [Candidatus Saccharibacteria bacterium]
MMNEQNQPELSLVSQLLEQNMSRNHFRILTATSVVIVLILAVTTSLKAVGMATPAITYPILLRTTIITGLVLAVLWWFVKRYKEQSFTKWLLITGVFIIMMIMRTAPTDAPETQAVFYLVIVMSLFYFDLSLLLYCCILCVLGDLLILELYPGMMPQNNIVVTLIIRYLCYLWVAIAAVIGSLATKELINEAAHLKFANVRLQEDIERKERMDKVRKDFISGASHELQSPISLIEGYAEGLKDNIVPGPERDYSINVIIDEARKMGLLVADMLELSKLESGQLRMDFRTFYLDGLVRNVVGLYSKKLDSRGIMLHMEIDSDQIIAFGDPVSIEHVIGNYLRNAIQYVPDGGWIRVSVFAREDQAVVEVENQGEHIANDDLEHIWLAFYRTEQSRSRKFGGTGLGLAIVKSIIQRHHGDFGIYNTEDGVCAYFSLKQSPHLSTGDNTSA